MIVQVVCTTDGKHKGEKYEIPAVTREVMTNFGMDAHSIVWKDNICIIQSSNYTIKVKQIGE